MCMVILKIVDMGNGEKMNQRDKQYQRNDILRLVRISNRVTNDGHTKYRRSCAIEPGNTWEHELCKFKKCFDLVNAGHHICTEAIFLNGKRGDIVDLDTGFVWEILKSETLKQVAVKAEKYPDELTIYCIDALTGRSMLVRNPR